VFVTIAFGLLVALIVTLLAQSDFGDSGTSVPLLDVPKVTDVLYPTAEATLVKEGFKVARDDTDIGDVTLTASAHLVVTVATAPGQPGPEMTYAELVIVPIVPPSGGEPPSLYGLFAGCNPMLGPPHGGSPACNRAITSNGSFDLLIPAGEYYVYATRGPFATLDGAQITVAPGQDVSPFTLVVESLPSLLPTGVVSGDFHVHGAASFDSSIPDQSRVTSFLTAGVDVIVATDHDVVTSYQSTLMDLSATSKITILSGVEQTPNIPWFAVPARASRGRTSRGRR
jgi:hypothetical protein